MSLCVMIKLQFKKQAINNKLVKNDEDKRYETTDSGKAVQMLESKDWTLISISDHSDTKRVESINQTRN